MLCKCYIYVEIEIQEINDVFIKVSVIDCKMIYDTGCSSAISGH